MNDFYNKEGWCKILSDSRAHFNKNENEEDILWQYISSFVILKIGEERSFKENKGNDLKYDAKMMNKTIKTVIVYQMRHCAEPSPYVISIKQVICMFRDLK